MRLTDYILICVCYVWIFANPVLSFTQQEIQALKKFRPLVQHELYLPYMETDAFLLRWIIDRNFDLNAAKIKLLNAIRWRKENKIDEILTSKNPYLDNQVKYGSYIRDVNGNPVIDCDFGGYDFRRIVLAGRVSELHKHFVKMLEKGMNLSAEIQKTKPEANAWSFIGDFRGFTLRQHSCLGCIPIFVEFITNYERYFTGCLKRIMPVNAPRAFEGIANIVKSVMSPGTKKAFTYYGSNQKEWDFLDTLISRDQLPPQYGGTKKINSKN